jgi:uncharacterized protein (DUF2384 family)
MNEPLTLHWDSPEHHHSAMLMPDLFGGWVLVTTSGERDRAGRVHRRQLSSYEEGMEALRQLRHRRRREGCALRSATFTAFSALDHHAEEVRSAESDALLRLFMAWGLDQEDQAALTGLDARALGRLQDGHALRDDPGLLSRVNHLLAINKVLRLRFGADDTHKRDWLNRACPALEGRTPLEVMRASPESLAALRTRLGEEADRARGCSPNPA